MCQTKILWLLLLLRRSYRFFRHFLTLYVTYCLRMRFLLFIFFSAIIIILLMTTMTMTTTTIAITIDSNYILIFSCCCFCRQLAVSALAVLEWTSLQSELEFCGGVLVNCSDILEFIEKIENVVLITLAKPNFFDFSGVRISSPLAINRPNNEFDYSQTLIGMKISIVPNHQASQRSKSLSEQINWIPL